MGINLVNVQLVKPRGRKGYPLKYNLYMRFCQIRDDYIASKEKAQPMYATRQFLGVGLDAQNLLDLGIFKVTGLKPPLNLEAMQELDLDLNVVRKIASHIPSDRMHVSDSKNNNDLKVEVFLRRLLNKECFQPKGPSLVEERGGLLRTPKESPRLKIDNGPAREASAFETETKEDLEPSSDED